ncbi:MAG: hypothetical protein JXR59_11280 [Desulfuromonadaceae bacterium]|nr:hypothetical protein [Desulfuromonadaceae bacterium]
MASQDSTTTKEKLLSVAIEVFVEKSYRDATLADLGQIRALIERIADDSSRDFFITQTRCASF